VTVKQMKSKVFLLLRFLTSIGILFYLFHKTDWSKIKYLIKNIEPYYYFAALLCVVAFQSLVALRWKLICEAWNFKASFLYYFKTYLMGFSLNTVFPGIVAGDTLRSLFLVKSGLDWKKAGLSVLLDRGLGLTGILLILSLSLPFRADFLPEKFKLSLYVITYSSLVGFFLLTLLSSLYEIDILKPLRIPEVIFPLFLGLLIQILFVFQFLFLALAIHIDLPKSYFFVIIPITSFLSALPLSISGLGVREGTLSYFLVLFNYSVEYGLSLGLLAYTLILLSAIPGVFFYFFFKKERN